MKWVGGIWLVLVTSHRHSNYVNIKFPKQLPWILTCNSYLIERSFFLKQLIEQQDSKIHGCWVWKLVSTKLKFNYDENLVDKI